MRLSAGLVAAFLIFTPGLVSGVVSTSAAAQATAYDLAPAPAANRGQVTESDGVKTFTAENGWYTMTFGPDDTTKAGDDVNGGAHVATVRYFTYGYAGSGHFVGVTLATNDVAPDEKVLGLDAIEGGMSGTINSGYVPSFLRDKTITTRKVMTLGDGNGRKPMQLMVWECQGDSTVSLTAASLLPKGNLMVLINADTVADAEAALSGHLRIAEGVLE